jgi:hypothetical protein
MELVLYPRAAPSDCVRVWLGAFQYTRVPNLTWELDGLPRPPQALRQMRSVRTDDMLPAHTSPDTMPRTFTGVYEFSGLQPDTLYTITVHAETQSQTVAVRTLPPAVPLASDQWFNVLLVSCFHQAEDHAGRAGTIVSRLRGVIQPHLTLLMGDQVYLDLPTLQNFPNDLRWLADKFETDYVHNWNAPQGYGQVLAAAPSFSMPDDHEYWNNYPHVSPLIENSWSASGRDTWRRAAQAMYEGFQQPYPAALGEADTLTIPPLSFFLADGRTQRDAQRRFTMSDTSHAKFRAWVAEVIAHRWCGVFVFGQSLLSKPMGTLIGAVADYALPDYQDFPRIVTVLTQLVEAGCPLLCLTGDVHWGRITEARELHTGRIAIREIITSPASLVTTIGLDQAKRAIGFLRGIFGTSDPWPRHANPDPPPAFFAQSVVGKRFACDDPPRHRQRGNHVALLSFRQRGGGLMLRVTYWPISLESTVARPTTIGPLFLKDFERSIV